MDLDTIYGTLILLGYAACFYVIYKLEKKIATKNSTLSRISLDYVKATRENQKLKTQNGELYLKYAKEVGFKNE